MIQAGLDVGSNSVRMLLLPADDTAFSPPRYYRKVTRLAGDFSPELGLSLQSMERTFNALREFSVILQEHQIKQIRVVGTAALRNAPNASVFIDYVAKHIGLNIEIIDGEREAGLSCRGILSVLQPTPQRALLFDIGGGSTELILVENSRICYQDSLALGVVALFEGISDPADYRKRILKILTPFSENQILKNWLQDKVPIELIGTAGTVTTLAAMKLKMVHYDENLVNNLILERAWLENLQSILKDLTLEQRLKLPGMEEGRADLIVPGIQIVRALLDLTGNTRFRVADAGLLEGLLLE